jgi:hypothetical protein
MAWFIIMTRPSGSMATKKAGEACTSVSLKSRSRRRASSFCLRRVTSRKMAAMAPGAVWKAWTSKAPRIRSSA